jgi:phage repressor protein C with HTH and peptisase S24 domain
MVHMAVMGTMNVKIDLDPDFVERINVLIDSWGGAAPGARAAGLSEGVIAKYRRGESDPSRARLVALAGAAGVSVEWLATGRRAVPSDPPADPRTGRMEAVGVPEYGTEDGFGDQRAGVMSAHADRLGTEFVLLPRYEVRAAAGGGALVHSEQVVDHLAFKSDWVRHRLRRNPAHLGLIEAMGDSMEPTIADGDLLLVDFSENKVKDNAIYALSADGDLIVKRIQRNPITGSLTIISDNPRYPPIVLEGHEAARLRVVGQVCWHGGLI